jgi:hypothetical protein
VFRSRLRKWWFEFRRMTSVDAVTRAVILRFGVLCVFNMACSMLLFTLITACQIYISLCIWRLENRVTRVGYVQYTKHLCVTRCRHILRASTPCSEA